MADARHEPREGEATDSSTSDEAAEDFEFRVVPTGGGLVSAGAGATDDDMCVADELFSHGRLLPLRPSSSTAADAPCAAVLLHRSESVASAAGFGSRYDCRSASSSGSSSGCVSRSHSSKSASSDQAPPRRSLSSTSSLFYAHPSPSPQLRSSRPRRSTGSSAPPPAGWGVIRLGVVGAPDVYPPRPADARITASASRGGSGRSRSARFDFVERSFRKHGAGLFGDRFGCKCSPDVVIEPGVSLPEAARKSGADDGGVKRGRSVRRIRILDWLEELSITKGKK